MASSVSQTTRPDRLGPWALIGHLSEYQQLLAVLDTRPGIVVLAADPLSGASGVVRLTLEELNTPTIYVDAPSAYPLGGVDAPSLDSFPPSEWSATHPDGTAATTPQALGSITIRLRTWASGSETMGAITYTNLGSVRSPGFLTKGDHNPTEDRWGRPVAVTEVVGKARGELPWFGLIKLTAWPTSGCCPGGWGSTGPLGAPRNSWDSLATSLVLIPVGIFLADYGFAFLEKSWKAYRRGKKRPQADAEDAPPAEAPTTESDDPR